MNNTNSSSSTLDCLPLRIFSSINIVNLSRSIKPAWKTLLAIHSIATPIMPAINLLIIWVVLSKANHRSKKPFLLLAAMAFTDVLVSLTVQPMGIWLLVCLISGCTPPCLLLKIGVPMTALTAMLTLSSMMMVSTDRYLAIEHPFVYSKIKIKHVVCSAIVIWMIILVALLTSALLQPVVGLTSLRTIVLVIMTLEVLVIIYCTGKVQKTAHRHIKVIVQHAVAVFEQATDEEKREYKRRFRECNHVKTVGIIILMNFILYSPMIIILILSATNQLEKTGDFKHLAVPLVITFINLQSIVNPFIVSLRIPSIRNDVKETLCHYFHTANA